MKGEAGMPILLRVLGMAAIGVGVGMITRLAYHMGATALGHKDLAWPRQPDKEEKKAEE